MSQFKNIDVEEFRTKMLEENVEVIDVRGEEEKAEGFIEGATTINIMGPSFQQSISELDKNKTYLIYCRSGNRSSTACSFMARQGFEKLFNLSGGIKAWNAQS